MFQLTDAEVENLRLQIETSSVEWGGRRYRPYAFTEHGVAMLSAVPRSRRAVGMSILIVRAFVRLRELFASNKELAARVSKLEKTQKRTVSFIVNLAEEVHRLKGAPARRSIGF